jgi:hypothetical protein
LRLAASLRELYHHLYRRVFGGEQFPSDDDVAEASRKYAGMTMNERLYFAGLVDRWDAAFRSRDREAMLRICALVGIAEGPTGRSRIVDTALANPEKYGF